MSAPRPAHLLPLDGTLMIEASAGTGKTWTLAMLYLRLVLEHELLPRQILVVTFTEAATAELRSRLRQRLAQALGMLDGSVPADPDLASLLDGHDADRARQRLAAALEDFDGAAVYTIHGFCGRVLNDWAFRLGQPPVRDRGEDPPALRAQLFGDVLRRTLESLHPLLPSRLDLGTPTTVSSRLNKWLEQPDLLLDLPDPLPVTAELNRQAESLEAAWRLVRERPEVCDPTARKAWHAWLAEHPVRIPAKANARNLPIWQAKLDRLLDMSVPPDSVAIQKWAQYFTRPEVCTRWSKS
ncbi:MAG: UvrD-helicase domain-containing protein, partial [Calditrichaeota bacterium]|nr:UvrD-helicase domain-containing protein [Calditrichota bacterium]